MKTCFNIMSRLAKENILDEQIKEFCDKYTKDFYYNYDFVKSLEEVLNRGMVGHSPQLFIKDDIGGRCNYIPLDCKATFGSANETMLSSYLMSVGGSLIPTDYNTMPICPQAWPKGKMNFPDFGFSNPEGGFINLDFKAVYTDIYKDGSKMLSPNYSSSLGDFDTIFGIIRDFVNTKSENGVTVIHDLAASLIALTYYSVDDNEKCTIEYIKVVPLLFYIRPSKDNCSLHVKQAGKNMNVGGGLRITTGNFETAYLDRLRTVVKNVSTNFK